MNCSINHLLQDFFFLSSVDILIKQRHYKLFVYFAEMETVLNHTFFLFVRNNLDGEITVNLEEESLLKLYCIYSSFVVVYQVSVMSRGSVLHAEPFIKALCRHVRIAPSTPTSREVHCQSKSSSPPSKVQVGA